MGPTNNVKPNINLVLTYEAIFKDMIIKPYRISNVGDYYVRINIAHRLRKIINKQNDLLAVYEMGVLNEIMPMINHLNSRKYKAMLTKATSHIQSNDPVVIDAISATMNIINILTCDIGDIFSEDELSQLMESFKSVHKRTKWNEYDARIVYLGLMNHGHNISERRSWETDQTSNYYFGKIAFEKNITIEWIYNDEVSSDLFKIRVMAATYAMSYLTDYNKVAAGVSNYEGPTHVTVSNSWRVIDGDLENKDILYCLLYAITYTATLDDNIARQVNDTHSRFVDGKYHKYLKYDISTNSYVCDIIDIFLPFRKRNMDNYATMRRRLTHIANYLRTSTPTGRKINDIVEKHFDKINSHSLTTILKELADNNLHTSGHVQYDGLLTDKHNDLLNNMYEFYTTSCRRSMPLVDRQLFTTILNSSFFKSAILTALSNKIFVRESYNTDCTIPNVLYCSAISEMILMLFNNIFSMQEFLDIPDVILGDPGDRVIIPSKTVEDAYCSDLLSYNAIALSTYDHSISLKKGIVPPRDVNPPYFSSTTCPNGSYSLENALNLLHDGMRSNLCDLQIPSDVADGDGDTVTYMELIKETVRVRNKLNKIFEYYNHFSLYPYLFHAHKICIEIKAHMAEHYRKNSIFSIEIVYYLKWITDTINMIGTYLRGSVTDLSYTCHSYRLLSQWLPYVVEYSNSLDLTSDEKLQDAESVIEDYRTGAHNGRYVYEFNTGDMEIPVHDIINVLNYNIHKLEMHEKYPMYRQFLARNSTMDTYIDILPRLVSSAKKLTVEEPNHPRVDEYGDPSQISMEDAMMNMLVEAEKKYGNLNNLTVVDGKLVPIVNNDTSPIDCDPIEAARLSRKKRNNKNKKRR